MKILSGNPGCRAIPTEPTAPVGRPDAPPDLTPDELQVWNRLADRMEAMKVLTQADEVPLVGLTLFYSLFRSEWAAARVDGPIVKVNGQPVPNPHLSLAMKLWDQVRRLAPEFGLTPSARTRLQVEKEKPRDEFDAFIDDDLDNFNRSARKGIA